MKVVYDPETDSVTIRLRNAQIRESDEISPRVIADYGFDGEIVSFEIMNASQVVDDTASLSLEFPA